MGSREGDGEWTGGVTGADLEAETRPPENCAIPSRSARTHLGKSDGTIEFGECIENANVQGRLQNIAYCKGKCALGDDTIMHALEIEMSHSPNEEPTNPITECSKEDTSSIQGRRRTKMKITPISKENHKRDNCSLPQLDEGAMKCQALESDAFGLDARVEGGAVNPTEPENNMRVYDVEMAAYGNYKGHGLPLALLISKLTRKCIKGYPVTVEVLKDSCPAQSTEVHRPAISCFDCLIESRISVPRQARSLRKPSGSRKILEHDLDESWGPSHQGNLRKRSNRPEVTEDFPRLIHSASKSASSSKPASSPRQTRSFPSFLKMIQVRI